MSTDLYLEQWQYDLYKIVLNYGGSEAWNEMRDTDRAYERNEIDRDEAWRRHRELSLSIAPKLEPDFE